MRGQNVIGALSTFAVADAMQRRMIGQVLDDREIEVEGARLEYDTDHAQGFARSRPDIMAKNADMTALDRVEAGHQRKQSALSGPVEAQQNCECRGRDRDADVIESLARAVGMADALDRDRRRLDAVHCVHMFRVDREATGARSYRCEIAIPQGSSPTWIVLITLRLATSMTDTSFETPLVVRRYLLVRGECQVPDTLADEQIFLNLVSCAIDNGHTIGGPERHKCGLAVLGDVDADRLDRLLAQAGNVEGDLLGHLALDGVDDAHRSADLGGYPKLRAVVLELGKARTRIDQHIGDDLARLGIDEMRHIGGLGGIDQNLCRPG